MGKPTEKAFNYAVSLINQANCSDPAARLLALKSLVSLDAQGISSTIKLLQPVVAAQGAKIADVTPAKVVEGWYLVEGEKYQIKLSKKGYPHIYNPTFIHGASQEGSAIIAAVEANGKALAIDYAKATGKCGVCNTELTDPKSIAAGIGPVCAKKF